MKGLYLYWDLRVYFRSYIGIMERKIETTIIFFIIGGI